VIILLAALVVALYLIQPIGTLYSMVLRSRISRYAENATGLLAVGADLGLAGHSSGLVLPLDIKLKQLEVLHQAGADVIRVTQAYDPWIWARSPNRTMRERGNRLIRDTDVIIAEIRGLGHEVMIADAGAEIYWREPVSWEEFKSAHLERIENLTRRYRPRYYVLVKEPVWYSGMSWGEPGGMITDSVSPEMWVRHLEDCIATVKSHSPETLSAIAAVPFLPESRRFFRLSAEVIGLDIMGMDVYRLKDLDPMVEMRSEVPIGKQAWILETWDGKPDEQDFQPWRERTGSLWVIMMSNLAKSQEMAGMVIFYSRRLSYSRDPRNLDELREALEGRTRAFEVFRGVAHGS